MIFFEFAAHASGNTYNLENHFALQ